MTIEEQMMIERFRIAFPHTDDWYCAVGFFRACGLAEGRASALAESVSTSSQERSLTMRTFILGIVLGSALTAGLGYAGNFYDSHGKPNAPRGSIESFDYFRQRQALLDLDYVRRAQESQSHLYPCGR